MIQDGPNRGKFHVDLSPLAEAAGDPRLGVCLTAVFDGHAAAVAAEVAFIERHWVLGQPQEDAWAR